MPSTRKTTVKRTSHHSTPVRVIRFILTALGILAFIIFLVIALSWLFAANGKHFKDDATPTPCQNRAIYELSNFDPQHPAGTVYCRTEGVKLYAGVVDKDNNVRMLQETSNPFRLSFRLAPGERVAVYSADSNAQHRIPKLPDTFNITDAPGGFTEVLSKNGEAIPPMP